MSKIFLALLFITALLTPLHNVNANESAIGVIAEIEGTVAMAKGEEAITPEIGKEVFLGDIIETGPTSKALILFIDDTELTMGENSRLTVDEYVFDSDTPDNNKGRFSVLRGSFVFISGLISKREKPDVKIETTYGSIGIRGTIVWGGDIDDEYNVFVQQGEVSFATDKGRVIVRPGQGTKVKNRRAIPSRAKQWGEAKIARAQRSVALKNGEKLKKRVAMFKEKHKAMHQGHKTIIQDKKQKQEHLKQESKRQMHEKRQENKTEYRPKKDTSKEKRAIKKKELRGGDSAPAHEMREKNHIQKRNTKKPRN